MKQGIFLSRLRRDQTGNVMYLAAGLLLPIMATIGSGVDLGQAYMAKSRLQQACDAGVLAGRKAMAENNFGADAQVAANDMFEFNYPEGIYDSTGIVFTPTQRSATEVTATANASVTTIMMHMFGKDEFNLSVNCTAKLEISNADIMFVLDTTGSMSTINPGDSVNRITALKTETVAFFDTIMAADADDAQIRIGVVPYSSNVNVGQILMAKNSSFISGNYTTPSRIANFDTVDPPESSTGPTTTWSNVSGFSSWSNTGTTVSGRTNSNCSSTTLSPEYQNLSIQSGPSTSTNTVNGSNGSSTTTTTVDTNYNAYRFRYRWVSSQCRLERSTGIRRERVVSSNTNNPPYQVFRDYTYRMINYDVTGLKLGTGMNAPTGVQGAPVAATWSGCIMERDTVAFDDAAAVPSGAFDLDVDLVPSSEATRWHMSLPNISHPRSSSFNSGQSPNPADVTSTSNWTSYADQGGAPCPAAAMKLTALTASDRSSFQSYINTLTPAGNTYHDFGMVWGTRLISPTGIMASENASAPNGNPISRHVIFMTDGDMVPNAAIISAQGVEQLHQRVGSVDQNELTRRHNKRYLSVCDAAKSRNITVWVVSFGTTLNSEMRACASGDKAFQANNAAQLRTQFQAIAQQITRLRLSE